MNKELREDLEHLIICKDKSITPDLRDDIKMTLDYIDELEKECIRLKEIAYNLTTATVCGDLKQIKNTAQYKLELAQQRIDKAIEYIEQVNKDKDQVPYLTEGETLKLLDILRGEDNE